MDYKSFKREQITKRILQYLFDNGSPVTEGEISEEIGLNDHFTRYILLELEDDGLIGEVSNKGRIITDKGAIKLRGGKSIPELEEEVDYPRLDHELDFVDRMEEDHMFFKEAIKETGKKGMQIARFAGLTLGLILTGFSLLLRDNTPELFYNSTLSLLLSAVGIVSLVVSLFLSLYSYSEHKYYFMNANYIGDRMKIGMSEREYRDYLLKFYSDTVERLGDVLERRTTVVRYSLLFLFIGISSIFSGFMLLIYNPNIIIELSSFSFSIALIIIGSYVFHRSKIPFSERLG